MGLVADLIFPTNFVLLGGETYALASGGSVVHQSNTYEATKPALGKMCAADERSSITRPDKLRRNSLASGCTVSRHSSTRPKETSGTIGGRRKEHDKILFLKTSRRTLPRQEVAGSGNASALAWHETK